VNPVSSNRRLLWLDPTFGASGDMLLGVMVGLGAKLSTIANGLEPLAIAGWLLSESAVSRGSLSATRVEVDHSESGDHPHRSWSSIDQLLAASPLPDSVVTGARRTFRVLAEAEASIHQVEVDAVHFHEVGAVDAIVDIVGAWLALRELSVQQVVCGPIGLGHGTVEAAHGLLPLPAPATAELLRGLPIRGFDLAGETVTPTGAALLATMVDEFGPLPTGTMTAVARGAGGRNPESHPNVLSAHLIEETSVDAAWSDGSADGQPMMTESAVIQTNLDDTTGEIVAHTIDRCLQMGADDAWAHPIVMKKGRPGVELNVLAAPDLVDALCQVVLAETATLGLRVSTLRKLVQPRRFETVEVAGNAIRIKIGPSGAKPEFDDLVAVAKALAIPVTEVSRRALQLHHDNREQS